MQVDSGLYISAAKHTALSPASHYVPFPLNDKIADAADNCSK